MFSFKCKEQQLILHPDRVIYWEEEAALILSDLHFGKTGHFRKAGIAVPQNVYKEDLQRLVSLIQFFNPRQLIIVGDLFHSKENKELDLFRKWRADLSSVTMRLIKGNHDILHDQWYKDADVMVSSHQLVIGPFGFCHDPIATTPEGCNTEQYTFSGHVHPGISIRGAGRQSLRFPCFYFAGNHCVLPAFSKFTGTYPVYPKEGEHAFAIVEDAIIRI